MHLSALERQLAQFLAAVFARLPASRPSRKFQKTPARGQGEIVGGAPPAPVRSWDDPWGIGRGVGCGWGLFPNRARSGADGAAPSKKHAMGDGAGSDVAGDCSPIGREAGADGAVPSMRRGRVRGDLRTAEMERRAGAARVGVADCSPIGREAGPTERPPPKSMRWVMARGQAVAEANSSQSHNPQSAVRSPQSAIRNPQSAIGNPFACHAPQSALFLLPATLEAVVVVADHVLDELLERCLVVPPQKRLGFGRVADELRGFRRADELRVGVQHGPRS